MSQHIIHHQYQGETIIITLGWDRPLQGFFMVICALKRSGQGYLYSNLDDPNLISCNGLPSSLDYFLKKLAALGLTIPPSMIESVQLDGILNMGNRVVYYPTDGNEHLPS